MTGDVPFKEVYCHSLVRDSEGRKMSKSLGNVVDPLDVISGIQLQTLHDKLSQGNLHPSEVQKATKYQKTAFPDGIPQCGADALRFTMINATTGGGDINLDVKIIHGYRKFCNKIFQATKYVLGSLPQDFVPAKLGIVRGKTLAERWILHKMNSAAKDINVAIEDREFSKSTLIVYRYWYNELCDVYIENSKAIIRDGTDEERNSAIQSLYTTLEAALTMIHPFMPYITEEMWQRMPRRPEDQTKSIMLAKYPTYTAELDDPESEAAYELVLGCSKAARSLMAEYALKDEAEGKYFLLPLRFNLIKFLTLSQSSSRPTTTPPWPPSRSRLLPSSPSVARASRASRSLPLTLPALLAVSPILSLPRLLYSFTSRVVLTLRPRSPRPRRSSTRPAPTSRSRRRSSWTLDIARRSLMLFVRRTRRSWRPPSRSSRVSRRRSSSLSS